MTIYGISGYRTPPTASPSADSPTIPHTKGEAEDIGVNSLLRSSAAQISEAELGRSASTGRSTPPTTPATPRSTTFQLIPSGGPLWHTRAGDAHV